MSGFFTVAVAVVEGFGLAVTTIFGPVGSAVAVTVGFAVAVAITVTEGGAVVVALGVGSVLGSLPVVSIVAAVVVVA
ncbi:MAG: hypothetical protein ABI175_29540, partial [Polyangiales bacterium]